MALVAAVVMQVARPVVLVSPPTQVLRLMLMLVAQVGRNLEPTAEVAAVAEMRPVRPVIQVMVVPVVLVGTDQVSLELV